jgi:hypothetical protein
VKINERSHELSPLPSHSETHIQRAKGEHTTGEHTGAHTPGQGAEEQPRLSLSVWREITLFTAPSTPHHQKGVWEILFGRGTHSAEASL